MVTPEMTGLICVRLVWHGHNWRRVEYLRICWTKFCDLSTIWKCFMCRWWICTLFFNLSSDVAMATE